MLRVFGTYSSDACEEKEKKETRKKWKNDEKKVRNGRLTEEEIERRKKELEEEGGERVKKISKKEWEARGVLQLSGALSWRLRNCYGGLSRWRRRRRKRSHTLGGVHF